MNLHLSNNFKVSQSHIQGIQFSVVKGVRQVIDYACSAIYSLGQDEAFCEYPLCPQKPSEIKTFKNPQGHVISCLAVHPTSPSVFVIGTNTGQVFQLSLENDEYLLDGSRQLYSAPNNSAESKVRELKFSADGRLLFILTNECSIIYYDFQEKRFWKQKTSGNNELTSISVDEKNQFICVIDIEGKAIIYQLIQEAREPMQLEDQPDSEDPFAQMEAANANKANSPETKLQLKFVASYSICSSSLIKKYPFLSGCFSQDSQFMSESLYLPGRISLQKVTVDLPPATILPSYSILPKIYHSKEILLIRWLSSTQCKGVLAVSTVDELILWNEAVAQKVLVFDSSVTFDHKTINSLISFPGEDESCWSFVLTLRNSRDDESSKSDGKLYRFNNLSELKQKLELQDVTKTATETQPAAFSEEVKEQPNSSGAPESNKKHKDQKKPRHPPIIQTSKLVPYLPQMPLESKYETYNNCRFLFYNNVGCIIERIEDNGESSTLQLQFHDRSIISRIKLSSEKQYEMFDLCSDTLVYASKSHIVVQTEKFLKEGYSWDYFIEDIEAVTIGGDWIAVLTVDDIKLFDWVGNNVNSVSFCRKYVAMAAYEDLLVIVYHANAPMFGVQTLKMVIFDCSLYAIKQIADVNVSLKPNNNLKWFGFSEDGLLFAQDEIQNLRFYSFEKNEWILTLSLNPLEERLFIQHIENYEIYGFRLEQSFPNEPHVMPRSLPRKIPFDLSTFKIDYLSKEENAYIKKHKLSTMWLEHEKYRYKRWYRHKYSLKKGSRWYERHKNIKSEEEIRVAQTQLDLRLMDYLKTYIKVNKQQLRDSSAWEKVYSLCDSLAFFNQTRQKLAEILERSSVTSQSKLRGGLSVCQLHPGVPRQSVQNLSQLDRLELMMGRKWTEPLLNEEKQMEVE